MADITSFPLVWPESLPRNPSPSSAHPFRTALPTAISNVRASLVAFGADSGKPISKDKIIFSSNFGGGIEQRMHGKDTGVAVWFDWDGAMRCVAVDRYNDLAQNVQAIHHLIEADRTKLRYGGLEIVRAAYKGFLALPSGKRQWRQVMQFEVGEAVSPKLLKDRYRRLAGERHPDRKGGSDAMMAELNVALADAETEVSA